MQNKVIKYSFYTSDQMLFFCLKNISHGNFLKSFVVYIQLVGMLDMSVPVVAKLRRLLDSLPRETLPDVLAAMIRTSNTEKLQVQFFTLAFKFKLG